MEKAETGLPDLILIADKSVERMIGTGAPEKAKEVAKKLFFTGAAAYRGLMEAFMRSAPTQEEFIKLMTALDDQLEEHCSLTILSVKEYKDLEASGQVSEDLQKACKAAIGNVNLNMEASNETVH